MERYGLGIQPRTILPLPADVASQIKSSTVITSLSAVVVELLKNALDATATKVEATVDFGRGSCSVEDDGLGIAPIEFREEGALGKPYYTSKYYSHEASLGCHGTFLASLAAMSLLTITSHHHEHRSHNSITFHHSKAIDRQLPTLAQHELSNQKHGTRVVVRNLFGNLPVRVKQRAVMVVHKAEHDRQWELLKREVTGLLLSWRQPVSIRVRDADNKTMFIFNSKSPAFSTDSRDTDINKPRSAELQFLLNVLTQSTYLSIEKWTSWVPVSASTSLVSVKGAISLEPAPSKHVQYICIGVRPLSIDAGHNELYDEINRVFGLSSFGTVGHNSDAEDNEKIRRQNDKQFKNDRCTNRQLRGRKGVDRYPMFHLRINLKEDRKDMVREDEFLNNETNLQSVVEVLDMMITRWLSVHDFRPRKTRKRKRVGTVSSAMSCFGDQEDITNPGAQFPLSRWVTEEGPPTVRSLEPGLMCRENCKRRRSTKPTPTTSLKQLHQQPFPEWSQIKSGNPRFYDTLWGLGKQASHRGVGAPSVGVFTPPEPRQEDPPPPLLVTFDDEPTLLSAFNTVPPANIGLEKSKSPLMQDRDFDKDKDETMTWIDPSIKQTYIPNSRNDCIMPCLSTRSRGDVSAPSNARTLDDSNKSLRLQPRSNISNGTNTPWLDGLLKTWDNPIFRPAEKSIRQVTSDEYQFNSRERKHFDNLGYSPPLIEQAFNESSVLEASKLSKEGLQNAEVIAQLDKKFILIKMPYPPNSSSDHSTTPHALVLIDQHAADERIRVESLMHELCVPLCNTRYPPYRSNLGHESQVAFTILEKPLQFMISLQEQDLFITHARRFSAWGILFDTLKHESSTSRFCSTGRVEAVLSVTTLPPSISERCRAHPKLLISFLRATVWKFAEDPHLPPLPVQESLCPATKTEELPLHWIRRLSICPQGLVDLINSRACRSAIMFNDELTMEQCEGLVVKLSKCVFPFMCAHGRPSMVPLIDLDDAEVRKSEAGLRLELDGGGKNGGGFINAWNLWKN
ncbi:uncharacterized protein BDR25DRAFT_305903 [Lindgomyces ingoldianus]|uniref:Uncharacterized protein n=1 Tax=Lindgomyces ingoldianus TaxID=673940 RepID=A0ACB6QJQ1_9PLEO|nr:uncharacterized protein BDR25DRAFT_305903 [Lindgomyces ingoldianus]KAF2467130.1 hypothetical protein BDR25DRAFT_305903 [Lindgomyces ingoldianus]